MDRLQEKTTVPYPPVGADGGQSLSKVTEQSIAEEVDEHKPPEEDLLEKCGDIATLLICQQSLCKTFTKMCIRASRLS